MLTKTQGIVLQQLKYGDFSRIVHMYTLEYGRLAFMVNGIGTRSKLRPAFFQPLTPLDMEAYYVPGRNFQKVREVRMSFPLVSIHGNIRKTTMALFLGEVLFKTLTEEETNPMLFNYLYQAVRFLDEEEKVSNNFHLYFLVHLTRFLGFPPVNVFSEKNHYLDLREGTFVPSLPVHQDFLDQEDAAFFSALLLTPVEHLKELPELSTKRKDFLEKILLYFHIHLEGMGKIKSLDILHDVFK